MPTTEVNPTALKDRVMKILTTPKTEWPVIEQEQTDTSKLYSQYIAILAAIPAICNFIGYSLIGVTMPFVGTFRIGLVRGIAHMIVAYVLTLVGVYVSALIIDKLAPSFDSKPNQIQALKLVAYASTPSWIAGVLGIIPALGVLAILAALYAIYLFYLGLPVMMKTPDTKVIPYMAVSAVIIIVVYIVMGVLAGAMVGISSVATTF